MSTWLQTSASIQKRTSPLKFDHFCNPKLDFTPSDLSSEVLRSRHPVVLPEFLPGTFLRGDCLDPCCPGESHRKKSSRAVRLKSSSRLQRRRHVSVTRPFPPRHRSRSLYFSIALYFLQLDALFYSFHF